MLQKVGQHPTPYAMGCGVVVSAPAAAQPAHAVADEAGASPAQLACTVKLPVASLHGPVALETSSDTAYIEDLIISLGLAAEGSTKCKLNDEALLHCDVGILALLQRHLLLNLLPDEDDTNMDLVKQEPVKQLLQNKNLLECFLTSGDCPPQDPTRFSAAHLHERWARAVTVLTQLMQHDARIVSSRPQDRLQMNLAVGCALAYSSPCALQDDDEAVIDPVTRYDRYLTWHKNGILMPTFEKLCAWQMRWLFRCFKSEEELEWAHRNCPEMVEARDKVGNASRVDFPGNHVQYNTEHNGCNLFDDTRGFYNHTSPSNHYTMQEYHECGGVCGSLCFFATGMAQAFGVPASYVGQPGHCAMIVLKEPGHWVIGNNICGNGWSESTALGPNDGDYGGGIWDVPIMEETQKAANVADYSRSERMRTCARMASMEARGELLLKAAMCCPLNLPVWAALIAHITDCSDQDHSCDKEAWVLSMLELLRKQWLGHSETVVSKQRSVEVSDTAYAYHTDFLVDCADTTWSMRENSGFIDVDLEEAYRVTKLSIKWENMPAKSYRVLVSPDEPHWPREISRGCPAEASERNEDASHITAGTDFSTGDLIWFAFQTTAWLVIELNETSEVTGLHIQWWGQAVAGSYVISSSADGVHFTPQRTEKDAKTHPAEGEINGWTGGIPGWSDATKYVKLELSNGHPDGWSPENPKLFGLRQVRVLGYDSKHARGPTCNFTEVKKHTDATTDGGITVVPGWTAPATRVVRLELQDIGAHGRFGIKQLNVLGGALREPKTAMEVLKEGVLCSFSKKTISDKYYGDGSTMPDALEASITCAAEFYVSRMGLQRTMQPFFHKDFNDWEKQHWTTSGFCCHPKATLLINSQTTAHHPVFLPNRDMCYADGTGSWAEYSLKFRVAGLYDIYTFYTSGDPRPLWLTLDGVKEKQQITGTVIGDFSPTGMQFSKEPLQLKVDAGRHKIRLEADGYHPHISCVLFAPSQA